MTMTASNQSNSYEASLPAKFFGALALAATFFAALIGAIFCAYELLISNFEVKYAAGMIILFAVAGASVVKLHNSPT